MHRMQTWLQGLSSLCIVLTLISVGTPTTSADSTGHNPILAASFVTDRVFARPLAQVPPRPGRGSSAASSSDSGGSIGGDSSSGSNSGSSSSGLRGGSNGGGRGGKRNNKQNYVLALALDYGAEEVCPFVRSWRLHCPDTHIVLFVYEAQVQKLALLQVELVVVKPFPADHAMNQWRFYAFAAYIDERQQLMRGVVLSDVRDVVLQRSFWRDPVIQKLLMEEQLLFSLEGNVTDSGSLQQVTLKANPGWPLAAFGQDINRRWVVTCFGEAVAAVMEVTGIVTCAGVTVGSRKAMVAYLRQFLEILERIATPECKSMNGDQAIHNYMLWYLAPKGQLNFKHLALGNGASPIYTLGFGRPATLDAFGKVTIRRGTDLEFVPDVLHQYDRHKAMSTALRTAYACVTPLHASALEGG